MTLSHEPKLKFCLKKARRRGASKKLTKKKVRFEMPVQVTVAYWFPKRVYQIKQGVQSLMKKNVKRSTAGFDYESSAGASRDGADSLRLDSHFLGMGRAAKPSKNLRRPI
ncbi:hypothetical protein PoB_007096600 [Plakobranchus ocellatus]|uniref:Uncharacterized protein n=1 Tax=Plakobranchus ocellatus TaxID=259542 RepID=A0AAV4DKQ3_9GAST|nr:hypothetical protein PoB_007096600 [Plakobranchus ocellatus]